MPPEIEKLKAVLQELETVYRDVRPILVWNEQAGFVPKEWRDSLKKFTDLVDQVIPPS